jgi:hypothetical protein
MGSSIGVYGPPDSDLHFTGTAGGVIKCGTEEYLLLNHHLLQDEDTGEWAKEEDGGLIVIHQPSPDEKRILSKAYMEVDECLRHARADELRLFCLKEKERCEEGLQQITTDVCTKAATFEKHVGDIRHSSGFMQEPFHIPSRPKLVGIPEDRQEVFELDWAICKRSGSRPMINRTPLLFEGISSIPPDTRCRVPCEVVPGAEVYATGRTSGFQRGVISDAPCVSRIFGRESFNREWEIQRPRKVDEAKWRTEGLGIPGDSGAWVIDAHTHVLYGQVWARNNVSGPGPRKVWFTPIIKVFEHIERIAGLGKPSLPQTDCLAIVEDDDVVEGYLPLVPADKSTQPQHATANGNLSTRNPTLDATKQPTTYRVVKHKSLVNKC